MSTRQRKKVYQKSVLLKMTQEQWEQLQSLALVLSSMEGRLVSVNALCREGVDMIISRKNELLQG